MARTTLPRDIVIGYLDNAVRSVRTFTELCSAEEAARLVGLLPELVALRARFEEATAPDDPTTLVTNLVSEKVSEGKEK
jgi:hypothetical protein